MMNRFACAAFLFVSAFAFTAPAAAAGKLDALPVNQWTVLQNGLPGIMGSHAKFLWLPDAGKGFLWPCYGHTGRYVSVEDHSKVFLYDPGEGAWAEEMSRYPKDALTAARPDPSIGYVWLPGAKRILFRHGEGNRRSRKPAHSWLLNPADWTWEPLTDPLRMCDRSADFNPARGSDGASQPIWGALCYDAHNKEAVLIGGCGTWGRVAKVPEALAVGDWFYDETAEPKRIRRVLAAEAGNVTAGRKWYPANAGTWVFSEAERKWRPIAQPIGQQPPGRVMNGAVYVPDRKRIVCFGGDNFRGPLNDTWIYDCTTRTWSQVRPKTAPPPRAAHAMVYLPDQKAILVVGGYGPGWRPLKDVWVYRVDENTWAKLDLDIPLGGLYFSGDYDPKSGAALICSHPFTHAGYPNPSRGAKGRTFLCALKLHLATAPKAEPPESLDPKLQYHSKIDKQWGAPLPGEWNSAKNAPEDADAVRKELAALPANTWVLRKQPMPSRARQWGKYIYDERTHKGYAWGGGHYGYTGCEMSEYDLLTNRWKSMNDPVSYKVNWNRGGAGGVSGPSFHGYRLMGTHARKSYAIDYVTDSVITFHGDIYSIAENRFVTCIGRCPGPYRAGNQVAFVGTPHGVFGFHSRGGVSLYLADVKAGKWNPVAKGGPKRHNEYGTLCHDRKRDRLIYTSASGEGIWTYDVAAKAWAKEEPANASVAVYGDATYVDGLDAALWVCGESRDRNAKPRMVLYNLAEHKWYTAPYQGARFGGYGHLNNSPCYDPKLKIVLRLTHIDRNGYIDVGVMRLDVDSLELTATKAE